MCDGGLGELLVVEMDGVCEAFVVVEFISVLVMLLITIPQQCGMPM